MASDRSTATRRDFLRRQIAPAFAAAFGGRLPDAEPHVAPQAVLSFSRTAMACRFEVVLPAGDERHAAAAQAALALASELERQMTVFRPDSEISELNRSPAGAPVRVEPRLFGLLQLAARLAEETAGVFDITTGALDRLWRRCRTEARLPAPAEVEAARQGAGMQHMRLDEAHCTVEFARDGVELNLGAIGKGYALDRIAEELREQGVASALIHAGHSSICAIGYPPWAPAWAVSVSDPRGPSASSEPALSSAKGSPRGTGGPRPATTMRLRDRTMSTSGSAERFFEVDGKRYGHIIDPRTGWPAQSVSSVTAIAPTAAEADALSTAFYIMGGAAARAHCERHPEVAALVICEGDAGGAPQQVNIGIPEDMVEVTA